MTDASASAAGPREIVVHAADLARAREILKDQQQA